MCALSIFCAVTRVSRGRWVNVVRGDSYIAGVVCQLKFLHVLKIVRGDSYIAGVVCQLNARTIHAQRVIIMQIICNASNPSV